MKILLKAGLKKQRGSLIGIFILMLVTTIAIGAALSIFYHSEMHISEEMERIGFGTSTAWVNGNVEELQNEIQELHEVEAVKAQYLLFSRYSLNGVHSDDDGQLVPYYPEEYDYHFYTEDLNAYTNEIKENGIAAGDIYLSPVMADHFQAAVGDEIFFELGRDGTQAVFRVAGFFEDPFAGSSMIDMKIFLINQEDYRELLQVNNAVSDFDRLGREGAMLHIYQNPSSELSQMELNQLLNSAASLGNYTEMHYSAENIRGYMLILQNIETGFLIGFSILLLIVILIVIENSIRNAIAEESKDIGILKTTGCTAKQIWNIKIMEYGIPIVLGMVAGLIITIPVLQVVSQMTVTSTGILISARLPVTLLLPCLCLIGGFLFLFLFVQTKRVTMIKPLEAIKAQENEQERIFGKNKISPNTLGISLALRQVMTGWSRYLGVLVIMILLTIFLTVVGRMSAWVGSDGEGLMNSFSVADHDLGFQPMSKEVDMAEVTDLINSYSAVTDTYRLAMQSGTVNGIDITVNVLDEPEWFHVIRGSIPKDENEILLTETMASDLKIGTGSEVSVSSGGGTATYIVSGIYECANDMGANLGMNIEGYSRIADEKADIWCTHYLIEDATFADTIMDRLMEEYRVDGDIHDNSWSGLDGIVRTLHLLIYMMYAIAIFIICVVVILSGSKVLRFEKKNIAVYKSLGFTSMHLRISFGMRYGFVALAGTLMGILISIVSADALLSLLLGYFGIGRIHSDVYVGQIAASGAIMIGCVFLFAVISSKKIKNVSVKELLQSQ